MVAHMDEIMALFNTSFARRRPVRSTAAAFVCILFFIVLRFRSLSKVPSHPVPQPLDPIPHKIWQIWVGYSSMDDDLFRLARTWPIMNQDYQYTLVGNEGANQFVQKHYSTRPDILETFLDLKVPVLRSDLLRYLILESEGGVYSDLDTSSLKPFEEWIPSNLKEMVRAVIGVEYDQGDDEPYIGMDEPLQFCQWTMASSPGHPIMKRAVSSVIKSLQSLAKENQTTVGKLDPSDGQVMTMTGPLIWTQAVIDSLSQATGTTVSHVNITGMKEPRLFGDILILPIDGFGSGQPHSNSWRGEGNPPTAMVRHMWKGSWKHGWSN